MAKRSPFEQLDEAVQALLSQPGSTPRIPKAIASLAHLAADLRDLPRANFKSGLKADLQRSISMTTKPLTDEETQRVDDVEQPATAEQTEKRVNPVRPGFRTITPYLIVNEAAELIDFVKNVFGAKEDSRSTGSAGGIHCEVRIGESVLMIGGGGAWRGTPSPAASTSMFPTSTPPTSAQSKPEPPASAPPPTSPTAIATPLSATPTAITGTSAPTKNAAQANTSRKACCPSRSTCIPKEPRRPLTS
jgi:hypothetical protein